jgi:hypothetical protein
LSSRRGGTPASDSAGDSRRCAASTSRSSQRRCRGTRSWRNPPWNRRSASVCYGPFTSESRAKFRFSLRIRCGE